MRWLPALAVLASCGDNLLPPGAPLARAPDLAIVAHQDDDLIFMQPDLYAAVEAGAGVTNVYVTAGNADGGLDDAEKRYAGLMSAYGAIVGSDAWGCGWVDIAGHRAEHCRLADAPVSLVFLGYPDGGKDGEDVASLAKLWDGSIPSASTIARDATRYDRDSLIATVTAIIDATAPTTLRTLEIAQTHGRDHSDHRLVGALALTAAAAASVDPAILSYRGYANEDEPANVRDELFARSAAVLARYEACATDCAACGEACEALPPAHEVWLARRYAVGMRRTAHGLLRLGDRCASADASGSLLLSACDVAETWRLPGDRTLRVGDRCLQLLPTGELVAGADCTPTPERRFYLDDEGHIWSGLPPAAEPGSDPDAHAYLRCVTIAGDRPRTAACGAARTTTWELSPAPVSSARPLLAAPPRALQLADFTGDRRADLCGVVGSALRCAAGVGDGTFAAPLPIGGPLPIEPQSLAIGDVDGDRSPDACGRTAGGISCALSTRAYAVEPVTAAFARTAGAPPDRSDLSLAIVGGELCTLTADGFACARRGGAAEVRSPAPAATARAGWAADLDTDGRADWCALEPDNLHDRIDCGRSADAALTTAGAPWGFSFAGVVDPEPADRTAGALADIDGDGRADLCTAFPGRVACARNQGHAFGPAFTVATLPRPIAPALWAGDLDGDGRADVCVDDGAQITCALL